MKDSVIFGMRLSIEDTLTNISGTDVNNGLPTSASIFLDVDHSQSGSEIWETIREIHFYQSNVQEGDLWANLLQGDWSEVVLHPVGRFHSAEGKETIL